MCVRVRVRVGGCVSLPLYVFPSLSPPHLPQPPAPPQHFFLNPPNSRDSTPIKAYIYAAHVIVLFPSDLQLRRTLFSFNTPPITNNSSHDCVPWTEEFFHIDLLYAT